MAIGNEVQAHSRPVRSSTARRTLSLLAVDQQFAEGTRLRVPPLGLDRSDPLEGGKYQDVRSSAQGAGPSASKRSRSWRSGSSGLTA